MTTFDDDYIQLELQGQEPLRFFLKDHAMTWPPEPEINVNFVTYVRVSHSEITDEQRAGLTHVARGALYRKKVEDGRPFRGMAKLRDLG